MFGNYICFTTLPKINDLLCIFATFNCGEKIKISSYNHTILQCRQLIFENSDVIACPNLEGMYGIYIVVKESYYASNCLQEYLKKRNLKFNPPTIVSRHVYEECCLYTILAKLAPKWNTLSNYLVRGRNFLISTAPADCIHLSIFINSKGDTTFKFQIGRIKMTNMSLEKLELSDYLLQEFRNNGEINLKQQSSNTVRVLPSLKQGQLLKISKHLKCAQFTDYQQLKRHWKNMYGYRLPESDSDIIYLNLQFFNGSPIFTYPSICVRPYNPVFLQRVEPGSAITNFMTDLLKTVPKIFGDRYPVPSHMSTPTFGLNSVSQDTPFPNTSEVSLTPTSSYYKKDLSATQNSAFLVLPTQKAKQTDAEKKQNTEAALSQLIEEMNKKKSTQIVLSQKSSSSQSQTSNNPTKEKSENTNQNVANGNVVERKPYKPTFSKINKNICQPVKVQPQITIQNNKISAIKKDLKHQMAFLNNSIAQKADKPKENFTNNIQKTTSPIIPKFVPKFAAKFPKSNVYQSTTGKLTNNKHNNGFMTTKQSIENKKKSNVGKENQFALVSNKSNSKIVPFQPKINVALKTLPGQNSPNKQETFGNSSQKEQHNKRSFPDKKSTESPATKKVRVKPVIQEIEDMENRLKNNTLDKVTVPNLINWLKGNSVYCTTKDKKSDLIAKIRAVLSAQRIN